MCPSTCSSPASPFLILAAFLYTPPANRMGNLAVAAAAGPARVQALGGGGGAAGTGWGSGRRSWILSTSTGGVRWTSRTSGATSTSTTISEPVEQELGSALWGSAGGSPQITAFLRPHPDSVLARPHYGVAPFHSGARAVGSRERKVHPPSPPRTPQPCPTPNSVAHARCEIDAVPRPPPERQSTACRIRPRFGCSRCCGSSLSSPSR
jgi:hypothetical protein